MGMWANFKGRNPIEPNVSLIAAEMRPALYAWFTAHIQVLDPSLKTVTDYDPITDEGGSFAVPRVLYDSGANGARVRALDSTQMPEVGGQTANLSLIELQVKDAYPRPVLRSGLIIKIINGGENSALTKFLYQLTEAIDSSESWGGIWHAKLVTGGIDFNGEAHGYGLTPYGVGRYGD
ncbi:hypothetical protein CMP1-17 [Clavibacter phage CMP1]|uniref:Uncharacterized protein n=1 Tax=Clavibacter phage CMP1 TaxID=686439 RepID=D0U201_9CAUD|nr:hypothetical protein CMP1-17 [Clavibacter phage CMP1]ACY35913.1 hypothetical protein CMP1-17 [Clavibacter phage CMP1]